MPEAPSFDVYPVTLRGPLSTNSSRVVTFARIFTHDGRMYAAESGNKGKDIRVVSSYPITEDMEFNTRGKETAKLGPWAWSGCGCSSRWQTWSKEQLIAMDSTPAVSADGVA